MRNKYLGLILLWRKKLGYISQIDIWDKKRLINGRKRWFMLSLVPRNCGGKVVVNWIGQYFSPTVSRAWIKNKKIFSVLQCQVAKSNTFSIFVHYLFGVFISIHLFRFFRFIFIFSKHRFIHIKNELLEEHN